MEIVNDVEVVKRKAGRPKKIKTPEEIAEEKAKRLEYQREYRKKNATVKPDKYELRLKIERGGVETIMVLGRYKRLIDMKDELGVSDLKHPHKYMEAIVNGKSKSHNKFIEIIKL